MYMFLKHDWPFQLYFLIIGPYLKNKRRHIKDKIGKIGNMIKEFVIKFCSCYLNNQINNYLSVFFYKKILLSLTSLFKKEKKV